MLKFLASLLLLVSLAAAGTVRDTVILRGTSYISDTYIRSAATTTNYGASDVVWVHWNGESVEARAIFNCPATKDSVRPGWSLVSAKWFLYCWYANSAELLPEEWTYAGVTWMRVWKPNYEDNMDYSYFYNGATDSNWSTAGAKETRGTRVDNSSWSPGYLYPDIDALGNAFGTTYPSVGFWSELVFTADVSEAIAGTSQLRGTILRAANSSYATGGDSIAFYSSEYADANYTPYVQLIIDSTFDDPPKARRRKSILTGD